MAPRCVYTPQPLVQFMIASVEHILGEHFDILLDQPGVHIFDPFTGTGNFIVNLMQRISGAAFLAKTACTSRRLDHLVKC